MTKNECERILFSMMAIYSRHYPNPKESIRIMTPAWNMVLEDYSYEEANMGLKWFARSDAKGFPPAPGQIIDCIIKAKGASMGELMDEATAWSIVYKAMEDSAYHSEESFAKLPPILRRAVGSPEALKQMGQEQEVSVTRGQFARSYQQALARERSEASMPEEVRRLVAAAMPRIGSGERAGTQAVAWIEKYDGRLIEMQNTGAGWEP